MATTLATLVVGLRADSSQFSKQMKKASKRAGSFTKSVGKAAGSLNGLLVAGAAALAIRKLTQEIGDFEKAMSQVGAVTQATAGQMRQMSRIARDLGGSTEFSAKEAAEGMAFLGRAGFKTEQVMAAIPATLDLATAGMLGMAEAADITSNIMSSFGIEAAKTESVTDVLAITAASANTDILQMGEAMAQVGAFSSGLGVSVEDTAAIIGVLSNAGIQASAAGSALKAVFAGLLGTSDKTAGVLERLGLNLSDIDPRTKSVVEIIDILTKSGLGASEALELFGRRGVTAVLALQKNSSVLKDLTNITNNAAGASKRMATIMRDNLANDTKILSSTLSELILVMGDAGLGGSLRQSVKGITDMTRDIITLTKVFAPLLSVIGSTVVVIKNLVDVIVRSLAGTALAALSLLSGRFQDAADAMSSTGEGISQDFSDIAENFVNNFTTMDQVVEAKLKSITGNMQKFGEVDPGLEQSKKLREGLERDLEQVRQSLLTKEQVEMESFAKSQGILNRGLEAKRLAQDTFDQQSLVLNQQHSEALNELRNGSLIQEIEQIRQGFLTKRELENQEFLLKMERTREAFETGVIPSMLEFQEIERGIVAQHEMAKTEIERAEAEKRQGLISKEAQAKTNTILGTAKHLANAVSAISQAVFKDNKAGAIANAVVSTAQGITNALAFGPPPVALANAVLIGAAGAAQIATIASTNVGGSKSVPSISGGGAVVADPTSIEDQREPSRAIINIQGDDDGRLPVSSIRNLINQINEQVGEGIQIQVA